MPEITINAFKHYYEDVGTGPVLLMMHGANNSGRSLARVSQELAKTFHVLVPDMRGLGRSEHVPEIPPGAWNEDILGLLDHLGVSTAYVYGVSLGARVALRFAIDHPDRLTALILDAPVIAMESDGSEAVQRLFDVSSLPPERKTQLRETHGDDWEQVNATYLKTRNNPQFQAFYDLREGSSSVSVPTLILRGDVDDAVHRIAHAVELHARIKDSWLGIVPHTNFGLGIFAPARCVELINQFVGQHQGEHVG